MKKDANNKAYLVKVELSEILKVLPIIQKSKSPMQIWTKGNEETEPFEVIDFEPDTMLVSLKASGGLFSGFSKSKLVDKDILLKFDHERISYFSNSKLIYNESKSRYEATLNNSFYKTKKRDAYRFEPDNTTLLNTTIDGNEFRLADISSGGMALKISEKEASIFEVGKLFFNVPIIFNKSDYVIPEVEIMVKKEINPVKKIYLIGTKFNRLDSALSERIKTQISAEIRERDVRKMM